MKPKDPHTFTAEQSTQLRAHVRDQARAETDAIIGLAKALFEVFYGTTKENDTPLAVAWGFEDFDHYAEKEVLMHGGRARSYVRVYDELCVSRNFAEGELPPSITALRELSKVSRKFRKEGRPTTDLDAWVRRSKKVTACELQAEVETELYGKRGRQRHLGFHMQWAAANRCMKRIRDARESLGFSTNGEALERILNEWATGKRTPSEIRRAG